MAILPMLLNTAQVHQVAEMQISIQLAEAIQEAIKAASSDLNSVVTQVTTNSTSVAQGLTLGYSSFYVARSLYDGYRTTSRASRYCSWLSSAFNMASSIASFCSINMKNQSGVFGFSCFVIGVGLSKAAEYIRRISQNQKDIQRMYVTYQLID